MGETWPSPVQLKQNVSCSALKGNKAQLRGYFPMDTFSLYLQDGFLQWQDLTGKDRPTSRRILLHLSHMRTVLTLPVHSARFSQCGPLSTKAGLSTLLLRMLRTRQLQSLSQVVETASRLFPALTAAFFPVSPTGRSSWRREILGKACREGEDSSFGLA